MIPNNIKLVLQAILDGDTRPWARLIAEDSDELAELIFPANDRESARQLAATLRELGFQTSEAEKSYIADSADAELAQVIVVVVKWGAGTLITLGGINEGVKALSQLPENLRKLRKVLEPYFGRATRVSPKLQLEKVYGWLDEKYGDQWSIDVPSIEVKPIAFTTLVFLQELRSGNRHLLAIHGDDVEELPRDWLNR